LCVLLLITSVGCGTSRSNGTATTKTTATATPPGPESTAQSGTQTATQTTSETATATSETATATSETATGTSETATGTPPTGTETTTNPGAPASGGAPPQNARIPATFTILLSGALSPPTVTAPAHLPVQVTVISGDGRAHKAVLHTPTVYALSVPAHGRATVLITDLKTGRYPIVVDGAARGALVIGGAPGP
jgi:hypothetical protein